MNAWRFLKKCLTNPPAAWRSARLAAGDVFQSTARFLNPARQVPAPLRKHLRPKRPLSVVDVGAYEGEFTAALARYCGVARALLVEPIPDKAAQLQRRFTPPAYEVRQVALAERSGQATFNLYKARSVDGQASSLFDMDAAWAGRAGMAVEDCRQLLVEQRTLDELVEAPPWSDIDLLKLDAQGAEGRIILGATQTLRKVRLVWTEVSFRPLYVGACSFLELFQLLDQEGFQLQDLEPGFRSADGELLQANALFLNAARPRSGRRS
jgi:FkbM family methyltransferase